MNIYNSALTKNPYFSIGGKDLSKTLPKGSPNKPVSDTLQEMVLKALSDKQIQGDGVFICTPNCQGVDWPKYNAIKSTSEKNSLNSQKTTYRPLDEFTMKYGISLN